VWLTGKTVWSLVNIYHTWVF